MQPDQVFGLIEHLLLSFRCSRFLQASRVFRIGYDFGGHVVIQVSARQLLPVVIFIERLSEGKLLSGNLGFEY